MAQIAINQINNNLIPLIEDPQLGNLRMFIQGYSFQANTLSPNWMEAFQPYTGTAGQWGTTTSGLGSTAIANQGFMMLSGGTIHCTSLSVNSTTSGTPYYNKMVADTYHRTMDWANYPTQFQWKTTNGYTVFTGPAVATTSGGWYQVLGPNCANPTAAAIYSSPNATSFGNQIIYEDSTNMRLWTLTTQNLSGDLQLQAITGYETSSPSVTTVFSGSSYFGGQAAGYEVFFMGVDSSSNLWFCGLNSGTGYQYYNIIKVHPTTYAITSVISNSTATSPNSSDTYTKRRPSNIRRDSTTRRVFYSCHYNTSGALVPNRYVWDPTNVSGSVVATACTMTYPGSNTYATYATAYSSINAGWNGSNSYTSESWHMKPYQFSIGGTNYISFFICDKYPTGTVGTSTYMWGGTAPYRTIMTYSIGTGTNDNQLTYHSSIDPGWSTMPRDFIPLSAAGTTLAVPQNDLIYFWTFNASTGWGVSGPYPVNPRVIGLDQLGRLWAQVYDVGYGSVHVITPTTPITVNVAMATASFTYTGSNIATTANVTVSNSSGALMSTTVFLTINGGSMVFSNTGSKTQTITTSNVGGAIANLTITGGGYNTISASITSSM